MRSIGGRVRRSSAIGVALVLAAASAAACSSGGSTGGSGSGGPWTAKDALRHVHDTAQTSGYLEFGRPAEVSRLNGGPNYTGPLGTLVGSGATDLRSYYQELDPIIGVDLNSVTTALSLGSPPNGVEVLYGSFDAGAIGAKLAAWGYRKQDRGDGVTAWIWSDDHKLDTSRLDPDTTIGPGMMGWLNVVWVSKTRVAYGGATADLAAALPEQSKPLSGDAVVGPLADCLGPVLDGIVANGTAHTKDQAIPAIALGVTGTSPADIREEICVAAPDDATAEKFATALTTAVTSGTDYLSYVKWSDFFTDPKVEKLGGAQHVVRLTARPSSQVKPDFVIQLMYRSDYQTLLGLPMTGKGGVVIYPDGKRSTAPPTESSSS